MARRPEVHAFLRIGLEITVANLGDEAKFTAHPWVAHKDLFAEAERRGMKKELTPGKFACFWSSWDDFRLDQSVYALVTARLWELPTAPARRLLAGLDDVLAKRIKLSILTMQVAHLDDRLRHRTAISYLLQSAPILDASCRSAAQEVHREFFRRNFELWLNSFHRILEALSFSIEDGNVRDLASQMIAVADGLAERVARTGDDSPLLSSGGSSLLGKTALQLFWSMVNAAEVSVEDLVDNEVRDRLPKRPDETDDEESA